MIGWKGIVEEGRRLMRMGGERDDEQIRREKSRTLGVIIESRLKRKQEELDGGRVRL